MNFQWNISWNYVNRPFKVTHGPRYLWVFIDLHTFTPSHLHTVYLLVLLLNSGIWVVSELTFWKQDIQFLPFYVKYTFSIYFVWQMKDSLFICISEIIISWKRYKLCRNIPKIAEIFKIFMIVRNLWIVKPTALNRTSEVLYNTHTFLLMMNAHFNTNLLFNILHKHGIDLLYIYTNWLA